MFTGIVEDMGRVEKIDGTADERTFTVVAARALSGLEVGDSISVNGVCLTAVQAGPESVSVVAVAETLARTNLGDLAEGDFVNLERPLAAAGRFDGHIVQGHVDGVAVISAISPEERSHRVRFAAGPGLLRYIVEKGSVTVDGVSLTVTAADETAFELVLIPHTLEVTVLGRRRPGDRVNVEVDIIAKYVERLLEERT